VEIPCKEAYERAYHTRFSALAPAIKDLVIGSSFKFLPEEGSCFVALITFLSADILVS
jgi:hypothetical protein